jgi:vacuolar protein-sorting-associated protein 4
MSIINMLRSAAKRGGEGISAFKRRVERTCRQGLQCKESNGGGGGDIGGIGAAALAKSGSEIEESESTMTSDMTKLRKVILRHYHMYGLAMDQEQVREGYKHLRCALEAMFELFPLTTGVKKEELDSQITDAMEDFKVLSAKVKNTEKKKLSFDDIIGHDEAKQYLKRELECFHGAKILKLKIESSPILLYGPAGCGKSYIAEAIANECGSTYQRVCPADINNRYFGESEKAMKQIFAKARKAPKSVIFFDELHLLISKDTEEVSRGLKSVFLTQMSSPENSAIVIIGATNKPWEIETAILRRFEMKIGLTLPEANARAKILQKKIESSGMIFWVQPKDMTNIANRLDGYTPSDLAAVAKAAQKLAIQDILNTKFVTSAKHKGREIHVLCQKGDKGAKKINMPMDCEKMNVKTVMVKQYLDYAIKITGRSATSAEDELQLKEFEENK